VTVLLLVAAVLLLLANAFFVAVEFALIATRRTALEPLVEHGDRRARWAIAAIQELNLQLAGSQLGITMASLGLGAVAEPAFAHLIESGLEALGLDLPEGLVHGIGFTIALAIVVFLHMVIGEMVPKSLAIAAPERTLLVLSGANRLYVTLFRPVIRALNELANLGVRALGVEPRDELATAHTPEELARLLAESREEGILGETTHELMTGALRFGHREVGSVLVPRDRIVALRRAATVAEAERLVVDSGVSRLLVLDDDGRTVTGFVHAKDLLTVPTEARSRPVPLARIRRVLVLDEAMPLDRALVEIRRARTHLAAVVDADRAFVGLVTLEDVLESLVGDIIDESDEPVRPPADPPSSPE
jgi:magnesium and cobalt exporter, CNNM family